MRPGSLSSAGRSLVTTMSSNQLDITFPMVRNTDPETSRDAAKKHAAKGLSERRRQVLSLVREFPGSTQGELARMFFHKYGGSIRPQFNELSITVCAATPHKRLPELEALGLVRRGDKRKCWDSGYDCATWWPV